MNESPQSGRPPASAETHPRRALAKGVYYRYKGHRLQGVLINSVAFRGHPEDDGGLEGVSVTTITWSRSAPNGRGRRGRSRFHLCRSEEEFFAMLMFANLCDPEHA